MRRKSVRRMRFGGEPFTSIAIEHVGIPEGAELTVHESISAH